MDFDLNKMVEDIARNDELSKEFSELDEMDEIYDYCYSMGYECSEEEFDEGVAGCLNDLLDEKNTRIKGVDPFYVIVSEDSGTEKYFVDFDKKGKPFFDKNVRKAYISQSWNDIQNTIDNVRANGGKKVVPVAIAMNIENTLQEPNFVIICKNKHSHKILYLQALYQNGEVRLNPNLKSAEHLGYDEAMEWYEELSMKNKEHHYAVVACPKDNVKSFNLVEYYKTHQNNMRVAVSFHLPDYKKKEDGKKK